MSKDIGIKFLRRVRRKLGRCQYLGPTSWSVNASQNGAIVVLIYHEKCSNGEGDETLTWRVLGRSAFLVGLSVNSPVLLTD